jgi:hypothetical protein
MCYSAKIAQDLRDYLRETRAYADLVQIEEIFRRRLSDPSVRIPRGFERNFDHPRTPEEARIRDLIDRQRAAQIPKLEQEIFKQRKRLADAERTLKAKTTKKALEDQRIATAKIDACIEKLSLLKGTQPHADDDRIFPMTYGPIVIKSQDRNVVRLARYHLRQAGKPPSVDRQFPASTTRDATTSRNSGAVSSGARMPSCS